MPSLAQCFPSISVQMASQEPLMLFLDICDIHSIFKVPGTLHAECCENSHLSLEKQYLQGH